MSTFAASMTTIEPASVGAGVGDAIADPAKAAVVDRILALNPTADTAFLGQFAAKALETYLAHLEAAQVPRGRMARWVRPGDSPAICWREAQE